MTAAIVLAGGASRRFGLDKTRVEIDGLAVLARAVDAVRAVRPPIEQIVVVGPWAPTGVPHVLEPDRLQGPLAALGFGLGRLDVGPSDPVLVLAGDHPLLVPALLEYLAERLDGPGSIGGSGPVGAGGEVGAADGIDGVGAVVLMGPTGPEPLVACYRANVRPAIERLVAAGERSMRSLLDTIDTRYVDAQEWGRFDPDGRSLLDIDTPDDLDSVLKLFAADS